MEKDLRTAEAGIAMVKKAIAIEKEIEEKNMYKASYAANHRVPKSLHTLEEDEQDGIEGSLNVLHTDSPKKACTALALEGKCERLVCTYSHSSATKNFSLRFYSRFRCIFFCVPSGCSN